MWVLVLIVSINAVTAIPNYPSKEACEIAGKAIQEGHLMAYRCIPGPR